LKKNGFSFEKFKKDIYYDGHEREDVVEYRLKWAKQMVEYEKRMITYDPYTFEEQPPKVKDGPRIVMVTHDESTFYANDFKQSNWTHQTEYLRRKKGPGLSLMVSEFLCPCDGTMRVFTDDGEERVARVIRGCSKN
jgi:hypothetical protein